MFPGWGDKSVCVVGEKTNVFDITLTGSVKYHAERGAGKPQST